ncbi:MAG: FtsX-like permease family protein, partial [Gemmatimonadetes bacterium]|nr:FtsX-like permease family protein [Gemmatimonadota bacterium]
PNAAQILEDAGFTVRIRNLKDDLLREARAPLMMLWVGVFFVLLIGCVNIANLMLARSNSRMREFAARMALGADKRRLMRQVITESVFLSLLGGILGMGVGWVGIRALEALGADDLPRGAEIAMSGDVLLFTLLLAVAAGVIFGAIPLVHIFRTELSNVFRQESRTGTSGRGAVLLRNSMVTGQVAIAFVLLIGAGLLMVSFRSALQVEPGFQPEETLTGLVSMPSSRYSDAASRRQFADDLLREVRSVPGVRAAGVTSMLPFSGNNSSSVIVPEGYTPEAGESLLSPLSTWASPGYMEAMGIPLLEGRLFQEADNAEVEQVIILDEWLARRYWPESSP